MYFAGILNVALRAGWFPVADFAVSLPQVMNLSNRNCIYFAGAAGAGGAPGPVVLQRGLPRAGAPHLRAAALARQVAARRALPRPGELKAAAAHACACTLICQLLRIGPRWQAAT